MKKLIFIAGLAILTAGCASFSTTQTDLSYDEEGKPQRTITTRASSKTLFEARSALANFKALQTDKSQSAVVGSLNMDASATNAVFLLNAISAILQSAK